MGEITRISFVPGDRWSLLVNSCGLLLARPRVDERAFYMNLAMNGLTKEGFEFAGMTSDEIVMKRSLK